jgi:hypothetical protein
MIFLDVSHVIVYLVHQLILIIVIKLQVNVLACLILLEPDAITQLKDIIFQIYINLNMKWKMALLVIQKVTKVLDMILMKVFFLTFHGKVM